MHMQNPHIPAMHFNTRYISTKKNWFGGGMDVTPAIKDNNEKNKFHKTLKLMCDQHNKNYYKKYKKWCDDCLLYTSPSPRDLSTSRMPSSA